MKRLTYIDGFNRSSDSEWAAPTFIQAKKTGDVCILTDFRRLNVQGSTPSDNSETEGQF
jgi:hypothetical protein